MHAAGASATPPTPKTPKATSTSRDDDRATGGDGARTLAGSDPSPKSETDSAAGSAVREGARHLKRDYRTWLDRRDERRGGGGAVIAHRGNVEGDTPPNTIASLERAARDRSSDAVEMDIQRLGDGTMVVYHDGDDPEISDGELEQMTADDLDDHPQIPTLEQWARRAGKLDVNVMAEFKESGYEAEAIGVLQAHLGNDQLAVMSFDPDAVRGVHAVDSRIPVALVIDRDEDAPTVQEQVDDLGFRPDYVEVVRENINEDVLASMTAQGIGVLVGKEDAAEQDALLDDPRIEGLLTDQPTQAAALRDDRAYVGPFGAVLPTRSAIEVRP